MVLKAEVDRSFVTAWWNAALHIRRKDTRQKYTKKNMDSGGRRLIRNKKLWRSEESGWRQERLKNN